MSLSFSQACVIVVTMVASSVNIRCGGRYRTLIHKHCDCFTGRNVSRKFAHRFVMSLLKKRSFLTACVCFLCVSVCLFLRSSIGGVAYLTVFNPSATWAATFRLGGLCVLILSLTVRSLQTVAGIAATRGHLQQLQDAVQQAVDDLKAR